MLGNLQDFYLGALIIVSGHRVSVASPHFGFIPATAVAKTYLPSIAQPLNQLNLAGTHYVSVGQQLSLDERLPLIPASSYRFKVCESIVAYHQPERIKKAFPLYEVLAELSDAIGEMLVEKIIEVPLFNRDIPKLKTALSNKHWQQIKKLYELKHSQCPSTPDHFSSELNEFLAELKRVNPSLPQKKIQAIEALFNQKRFSEEDLKKLLNLAGLPNVSLKKLIDYAAFKQTGRQLLNSTISNYNTRKHILAPFENNYAAYFFAPRSFLEKVILGVQHFFGEVLKPFLKLSEHWQPTVLN